ncbi:hypothetical protein EW146_g8747 [Bondarzewia mesenterica]|uniref:DUF726-domain-containing protein n=1 Tax=Bondarzewia mesenterica TaxID=1095465 RepID=A0A4S4LHC2_9AGAM|nr:hypothetical protein EW146_g8747 [Bondarzewia mesenterica]
MPAMPITKPIAPEPTPFDDDEGWEDMPIVRETDEFADGLDEEDQKKYHYVPQAKKDMSAGGAGNAIGEILDVDYQGNEWRTKLDATNESEYTRLRMIEEDEADEVHLRTRYLFDEDKAMTPLSQMQQTKDMLTEMQRVAYVGLCALVSQEMVQTLKRVNSREMKPALQSMELWALKILGRLYYHMELATPEQKMIENLALHGVRADDLVPSLMTTHTVANPEYDPAEARRQADLRQEEARKEEEEKAKHLEDESADISQVVSAPSTPVAPSQISTSPMTSKGFQTTARVLEDASAAQMPGVSTSLSSADEKVTLDIRWTVLCDLFLILIADSVYDARSRVLLENVAIHLGLGWLDVVKFEQRVTEALEIQEGTEKMEQREVVDTRQKSSRKRRYMMVGLATLGGGLVIGLSAGLLAPVIGAGLGAAFTTIGITGTAGFLGGTAGAAVITTGGVLTGSGIAARGMTRRTQQVRIFDLLPLHNNKRVNCIITVSGFMNGPNDDVRLPFSVLDPIVGDVFSVLWEPDMIMETGSALTILTGEVLTQIGQTVLQATVMTALMSALQWPIILTKLGYLIDNPWNNALDRAKAAGGILADVLIQRHMGVRPITLIGFSLGARVIFYALLELAKQKAFGVVQDVFLLGTTVTASQKTWFQARSAVSGRFVNGFARNDWVLNYLFRATSGGLNTVAGLRPVDNVPGLENVDVTDKISGHMSYRTFMPLILDQLGFPVSADHFDEPEEPDFEEDRIVVRQGEEVPKKGWFGRKQSSGPSPQSVSRPPSTSSFLTHKRAPASNNPVLDDDLPPRQDKSLTSPSSPARGETPPPAYAAPTGKPSEAAGDISADVPKRAGFDLDAIKAVLGDAEQRPAEFAVPGPSRLDIVHDLSPRPNNPRSQTAPLPPIVGSPTIAPTAPARRDKGLPMAGPSTRSDLSATFSRSLSLNDTRKAENEVTSFDAPSREQYERPSQTSAAEGFGGFSSQGAGPTLSFAGYDGAVWAPEPPEKDIYGGGFSTGYNNPFRSNESPAALGGMSGFGASTTAHAFGGADGSVSAFESDSWSSRAYSNDGKKASGFAANPWQT